KVGYRGYFIREASPVGGNGPPFLPIPFRVYREPKAADSPEWPVLELPESRVRGIGRGREMVITSRVSDSWIWVESGPRGKHPDVWIRLQHETIRDADRAQPDNAAGPANAEQPKGRPLFPDGLGATTDGVAGMYYGVRHVQDEGDLLLASRAS